MIIDLLMTYAPGLLALGAVGYAFVQRKRAERAEETMHGIAFADAGDGINALVQRAHAMAVDKGWYDGGERQPPELLMLIVSELAEALECYRDRWPVNEVRIVNGKPEGFPIEIADAVIRIADMCGAYGIDLGAAITTKVLFNANRPARHGNKAA